MPYTPRLSVDGIYQSKYYYGNNPFHASGYSLPNCTAYAWGRFYEISDIYPTNLPTGDGGQWYPRVLSSGAYELGQSPKLGAVACWASTIGGGGHVAIVEQIYDDGDFVISQSGYYRPIEPYPPDTEDYFWTDTCNGSTKKASWMSNYTFQGFIYNPHVSLGEDVTEWVAKNTYLTESEMQNNATIIFRYFHAKGWTNQAIAAMLGNMEAESTISPQRWQSGDYMNMSGGFGLTQWTPASKYINWAGADWETNNNKQLERIMYEYNTPGLQWIHRSPYSDWSFSEFANSTSDPYTLACVFAWNYEGSWTVLYGSEDEKEALRKKRGGLAEKWYAYIANVNPDPYDPPKPPVSATRRKSIFFNSKWAAYLMLRRRM